MAHVTWDGGGGEDTSWTNRFNWSGDTLPGAGDDVTIDVAANPTIRIGSGAQAIQSLVSNEALNISGGSLRVAETAQVNGSLAIGNATLFGGNWNVSAGIQVTGNGTLDGITVNNGVNVQAGKSLTMQNATVLNGELTLGVNASLIAGAQVGLVLSEGLALADVNLTARDGPEIRYTGVTTLTNVNLTANDGGKILFPVATSYQGGDYRHTTIQASGDGSKIDLSHLQTLVPERSAIVL